MSKNETKKITSIGGSALIEGIMMRGPKKSTVAVRMADGGIYTEDVKIKFLSEKKFWRIPSLKTSRKHLYFRKILQSRKNLRHRKNLRYRKNLRNRKRLRNRKNLRNRKSLYSRTNL